MDASPQEKPLMSRSSGLSHSAGTRGSEMLHNALLNLVTWLTCFSQRKESLHQHVSRESQNDLIHGAFPHLCKGSWPPQQSVSFYGPHRAVCLIFLLLNLCLSMGLKSKTKPGFCILLLYLSHNSEELAGLKMFARPWGWLGSRKLSWCLCLQAVRSGWPESSNPARSHIEPAARPPQLYSLKCKLPSLN